MKYWLLKTEPQNWSWTDQLKSKNQIAEWNGVRNYQASKNLKAMKKNDLCFFYHSGKEKRIIGIVRIIKEHFRDKTDKANKFVSVMVRGEDKLSKPVTLEEMKNNEYLRQNKKSLETHLIISNRVLNGKVNYNDLNPKKM